MTSCKADPLPASAFRRRPTGLAHALGAARVLGCVLLCCGLLAATEVSAFYGDRLEEFGVDGSVRTTSMATRNYDAPLIFGADNRSDAMSQTTFRLVAGGRPMEWLKFEVHSVLSTTMTAFGSPFGGSSGGLIGGSAVGSNWRMHPLSVEVGEEPGDVNGQFWLDRCELRLNSEIADVVIGRQAISFGKAWFWNPLDVFAAFGPTQLDRDYKPGVDALRIEVPIGEFSGLSLVAAMGDVTKSDLRREFGLVGRVFTTLAGLDLALQGALIRGQWQVGAAFSGEVEPVDIRAEVNWVLPGGLVGGPAPGAHVAGVLGVSRRFENELSVSFEHLAHTGGRNIGLEGRLKLAGNRQLLQASGNVSGLMMSYPLIPVLTGSLATMASWDDGSVMVQPGLGWSAADEVDVSLGGLLAFGERPTTTGMPELKSEFGTWPHMVYLQLKAYF